MYEDYRGTYISVCYSKNRISAASWNGTSGVCRWHLGPSLSQMYWRLQVKEGSSCPRVRPVTGCGFRAGSQLRATPEGWLNIRYFKDLVWPGMIGRVTSTTAERPRSYIVQPIRHLFIQEMGVAAMCRWVDARKCLEFPGSERASSASRLPASVYSFSKGIPSLRDGAI